jgi:hypothetical protein
MNVFNTLMMVSATQVRFQSCEHKAWTFGLSKAPHQFRTRRLPQGKLPLTWMPLYGSFIVKLADVPS